MVEKTLIIDFVGLFDGADTLLVDKQIPIQQFQFLNCFGHLRLQIFELCFYLVSFGCLSFDLLFLLSEVCIDVLDQTFTNFLQLTDNCVNSNIRSFSNSYGVLNFNKLFLFAYYSSNSLMALCNLADVLRMHVLIDSIWVSAMYGVVNICLWVPFHTFGAHKLQTHSLSAEVGYRFAFVLQTRHIVSEVRFHVLDAECSIHFSLSIYWFKSILLLFLCNSNQLM
jgi:hypothetical protein